MQLLMVNIYLMNIEFCNIWQHFILYPLHLIKKNYVTIYPGLVHVQ